MIPSPTVSSDTTIVAIPTLINGRVSAPGVGVWTEEEAKRFRVAMEQFPNGPWILIAQAVGTRTVRQTMTHAQKCRQRLERHARGLKPAGRKRQNQNSQNASPQPSLTGTYAVMAIAEYSGTAHQTESGVSTDQSQFDWVLQYLNSPEWINLEVEDILSMHLTDLRP